LIVFLEQIHKQNIIYRTLNPNNILLDYKGNIKVVDFGNNKVNISDEYYLKNIMDIVYIAPEIIAKKKHNHTADFWSLGIIIYEMVRGVVPFYNRDR
jgi:serine/threonine protein kinase